MSTYGQDQFKVFLKFSVNGKEYNYEETVQNKFGFGFKQNQQELIRYLGGFFQAKVADYIFNELKIKILENLTEKRIG